jgi:hypothetical protein
MKEKLGDQEWRLNNLYMVRDYNGNAIRFRMNFAQKQLFDNLHYFNVILKARQLGFSTFILIYMLDIALFNSNQSCGVIAHTRDDAKELFHNKIKFAYERIPSFLKDSRTANTDSASKIEFNNGSSIVVGTSLRGGTFQNLHISEFGKIAARYPDKAKEIISGALNTVHAGQKIFIESTAEGQSGSFFDIVEWSRKLSHENRPLSTLEPKFHFFPWFDHPDYKLDSEIGNTSISSEMATYFSKLPVQLTPGQKAWYIKKHELQQDMMKREFPSTPEEAFETSLEGAYYTKQMELLRRNNQITEVPYNPKYPVYTFWDLGKSHDEMSIWFMQHIGTRFNFINYHEAVNEGWNYYVNLLNSFGYGYATHYWPHDGGHNNTIVPTGVISHKQSAEQVGIRPIKVVPVTGNVHFDVMSKCKPFLTRCWFDHKCIAGIKHLDNYRRQWDEKLGRWQEKPYHDVASHGADAFRTAAVGYEYANPDSDFSNGFDYRDFGNYMPVSHAKTQYNMFR